jgi:glycosyltransferase involved in cell wall biosynthesis
VGEWQGTIDGHGRAPEHDVGRSPASALCGKRLVFVANVDWFFVSHRMPVAIAARDLGADVWVVAKDTGLAEEIRRQGLGFVPLAMSRKSTNPIRELATMIGLGRIYRRLRPALVHHVTIKPVLYGSVLARLLTRACIVNAISGFGYSLGSSRKARRLRSAVLNGFRIALRSPESITIFQNTEDRDEFVGNGLVPMDRTRLIRGAGVDVEEFSPGSERTGTVMVLMASRLLWDKGVAEFVEASRIVRASWPSVRFVLVGFSDRENPGAVSEDALVQWCKDGVIEWWGRRTDMAAILRRASVVVLPTFYREGVPKVLLEGAASGCPIVTTDIPGCRDVVRNGVNGLLVQPRDAQGLATAIAKLVGDSELRQQFGREGRKLAVGEFRIERVVEQTLEVYAELLPRPGIRGPAIG